MRFIKELESFFPPHIHTDTYAHAHVHIYIFFLRKMQILRVSCAQNTLWLPRGSAVSDLRETPWMTRKSSSDKLSSAENAVFATNTTSRRSRFVYIVLKMYWRSVRRVGYFWSWEPRELAVQTALSHFVLSRVVSLSPRIADTLFGKMHLAKSRTMWLVQWVRNV